MTARRPWGRYTEDEIEALVEGYAELIYRKDRPSILVRLADLDQAMRLLNRRELESLWLTRIVGLTNEAAGQILGVSEAAIRKRVRLALETIYDFLNAEDF